MRETPVNCGGGADSNTLTENVWVALRLGKPLSLTIRLTGFVLGPVGGVQEKKPLEGSIVAPPGALPRLKVSVCGGWSVSLA